MQPLMSYIGPELSASLQQAVSTLSLLLKVQQTFWELSLASFRSEAKKQGARMQDNLPLPVIRILQSFLPGSNSSKKGISQDIEP